MTIPSGQRRVIVGPSRENLGVVVFQGLTKSARRYRAPPGQPLPGLPGRNCREHEFAAVAAAVAPALALPIVEGDVPALAGGRRRPVAGRTVTRPRSAACRAAGHDAQ